MVLPINKSVSIPLSEIIFTPIRARGAGGQNVNKVSSAVQLRFDVMSSSLPASFKERLLQLSDQRITKDKIIVIKAQRFRTQEKNKEDALKRLADLIRTSTIRQKRRVSTAPSRRSKQRRTDKKTQRGKTKTLRGKVKQSE